VQDDRGIVSAWLQAEVFDQLRGEAVQVVTQQAQKPQAGGERDGALGGLENRDGPQRPPPGDGM
jgi:hypothetical protein